VGAGGRNGVATVLGDLLQSHEMKRAGEQSVSARGFARLLHVIAQRRLLILGIACNAVSFFSFMALVQTEPLSFAVPASSASFVLETLLAKFVLHERWAREANRGRAGRAGRRGAGGRMVRQQQLASALCNDGEQFGINQVFQPLGRFGVITR
jgi:hypothetical protein